MTLQKTFLAPVLAAAVALVAIVGLTAFVHADTGTSITATVVNGSNASLTSALVGTPLQANVVIASSSTTTIPTGTADFNLYAGTSCLGTATTQTGVALTAAGSAQSATTTLASGGLSYIVHYSGDTKFNAINSGCIAVTATQYAPTITTSLSQTNVTSGSTVYDTATLASASAAAGGTVTYKAYTDNACTLGAMSAGVKTVINAAVSNSDSLLFNTPGTYYWQAVYSGDANNAAATSTCTSATLTVTGTQAAPTISIGLSNANVVTGSSVYASSTLLNKTANAGGTVAYKVYSDNACTLNAQNAGTMTVVSGIAPNSSSLVFNTAGTYYFQAVYSGDANNIAATSSCASVPLTVTTTVPPTTGPGTISGTFYNDVNGNDKQDVGETGLAGWTVWLHMAATSSGWWIWGNHKAGYNDPIIATATTDANGNYSFGNLAAGNYFVEEQEPTGWNQTSSDTTVTLSASATSADVDFANMQKGTTGNGGQGSGNNGNNGGWNNGSTTGTTTGNGNNNNGGNNGHDKGDKGDKGNNGGNNNGRNDDNNNRGNTSGNGWGGIVGHIGNIFHK